MHVPYAFPCVNILSPVFYTLLMLRNPRSHIYSVKRLLVSPRSTAQSRSYGLHPPHLWAGILPLTFSLL